MLTAIAAAMGSLGWSLGPQTVPYELLVGFHDHSALTRAMPSVLAGAIRIEEIPGINVLVVEFPQKTSISWAASWLKRLPDTQFVEPNYIAQAQFVPNDPAFPNQFNLRLVAAAPAWDIQAGSPSVTIAILDSGVDSDHPELASKLKPGYDFVQEDTVPEDDFGHGTFCAGIAAAETNNSLGLAGAAPGCSLMPIKVLNSTGYGSYSDIAKGIVYAVDHGAKVISMSFAGSSYSSALDNATRYAWDKGAISVAAAGNQGNSRFAYPAALKYVLSVGSVNKIGRRSDFSNYGTWVSVAAPGEFVYSTYLNGGYASLQGTSMSAALVSGEAGLVASRLGSGASPGRIRFLIERMSIPAGSRWRFGVVNFFRSVANALP